MGSASTQERRRGATTRAIDAAVKVDAPTYEQDRTGEIKQWDERDVLFARRDLWRYFGQDTRQFRAYYDAHPEHQDYDAKLDRMPELGRTGGVDVAMFDAQFEATKRIASEAFVDGEPAPVQVEIPPERAARKVKGIARVLGADLVGIGPLRQEWVYSHTGRSFGDRAGFHRWGSPIDLRSHSNAVALGFRMDQDLLRTAPDFPTLIATAKGYAVGAWVAVQLAEYIRLLGFSARAHHLYNYEVLTVPVAVDCGLGELSRAGYLLSREMGLGLRLAVVTTDMPLAHDRPVDIGVQSFCDRCLLCAESCPIGAIPSGARIEYNGIRKWKLDEEKCYRYWHAVGTDCALCMTTCPWTKPPTWFHGAMSRLAGIKGPHQSWMVQADRVFYGSHEPAARPGYMEPRARQGA